MMNYFLPLRVLHQCTALLTQTWKARTQLSSSDYQVQVRQLFQQILSVCLSVTTNMDGDDNGVFNFEGGCYAKVINLDKESEPDIYRAIRRDALLETLQLTLMVRSISQIRAQQKTLVYLILSTTLITLLSQFQQVLQLNKLSS